MIDYSDKSQFAAAAAATAARRDQAARGDWIVGRWEECDGRLVLLGVRMEPGWWIDPMLPLSDQVRQWARWRTRQGAHQWLSGRGADFGLWPINASELVRSKRGTRPRPRPTKRLIDILGTDDSTRAAPSRARSNGREVFDDHAIDPATYWGRSLSPGAAKIEAVRRVGGKWASRAHCVVGVHDLPRESDVSGMHASRTEAITAAEDRIWDFLRGIRGRLPNPRHRRLVHEIGKALDVLDKELVAEGLADGSLADDSLADVAVETRGLVDAGSMWPR